MVSYLMIYNIVKNQLLYFQVFFPINENSIQYSVIIITNLSRYKSKAFFGNSIPLIKTQVRLVPHGRYNAVFKGNRMNDIVEISKIKGMLQAILQYQVRSKHKFIPHCLYIVLPNSSSIDRIFANLAHTCTYQM